MARPLGVPFNCECGTEVVMCIGPGGNRIPLERKVNTIYKLAFTTDPKDATCQEQGRGFLNHFVTCPQREKFRSKRDGG